MISLENACVLSIANCFENFYAASTVKSDDNDKNLTRILLQKKYSSQLAIELFYRSELTDEYLDFVLNEHLNLLDEHWLVGSRFENSTKDLLRRLPNLTEIFCVDTSDEILESIVKFCPKMVHIDGKTSSATDQGIMRLCKNENGILPCPALKKLNLKSSRVTVEGLKRLLQDLNSLEELHHAEVPTALYSLHRNDLDNFEMTASYKLVELDFLFVSCHLPYYNNVIKTCLAVCPKVKFLRCYVSEKEQFNLFANTHLTDLCITFLYEKGAEKINIDNFLKTCGSNLTSLEIAECTMTITELASSCPKLQDLSISEVEFLEYRGEPKVFFPCLISCCFWKIKKNLENDKAMSFLLSSPKLEELEFYNCELSRYVKFCIINCCVKCPLERIIFDCWPESKIELNFVKNILLVCPYLKRLDLQASSEEREKLMKFVDTLSNKPDIEFKELA